jgi:single-stranded-DNA-specific exonuclease
MTMRTPHEIITRLLGDRGISASEQAAFLHPEFASQMHDPLQMKGMKLAVERIVQAMQAKERIAVFGDYDADGVPATALLVRAFSAIGVEVVPYIPTRQDGYGLTMAAARKFCIDKVHLLITVDNGTVSGPEIAYLKENGIDTIVCDHHEPQEGHLADKAIAILNPKQTDCPYPFKGLCGCAIAWKLAWALYEHLGIPTNPLKWELDLVALSTIADMVPLLGENRVLAYYGIGVMRKSRNHGLQALASQGNIALETISAGGISFGMAPRINAPSRMHKEILGGTNASLRLLVTPDKDEAAQLAAYLDEQNKQRQQLLEVHLKEASEQALMYEKDMCLVLYSKDWSTGVIGLLAGRLLEQYRRPVVILANEKDVIKGSVRSVDGVESVSMIEAGSEVLERFGGHAKAAGLTFKEGTQDDVAIFRNQVNAWMANQRHTVDSLEQASRKNADMTISLGEITLELAQGLSELEPFGIGFPAPLFSSTCTISKNKLVGSSGQHLSCHLVQDGMERKAIGFQLGKTHVGARASYLVHFNVEEEVWQDKHSASCRIKSLIPL